jgi:hypothetical protein
VTAVLERPASQRASRLGASGAIALFFYALTCLLLSATVTDADLWGHLRFGQDILQSGSIPRVEPYSFMTGGAPWFDHEWLSEVVFAVLYALSGAVGLVVLKTSIALGTLGLVRRELLRHGVPALRAVIPLLPLALALQPALATVRPQMFTVLAFTLTMVILVRHETDTPNREGSSRGLWLMPLVFAGWVNFHGGFLSGAGILFVWLAARVSLTTWRGWTSRAPVMVAKETLGREVAPVVAALLATLANPYGVGLWTFLLRTATVPRPEIAEWQPLPMFSVIGACYLVLLALTGAAILASGRPRRAALLAIYLCLALAPLDAMRHLPLFAVGSVLIAAPHLAEAGERWLGPHRERPGRLLVPVLLAAAVLFAARSAPHFAAIRTDPSFTVPARAMALLEATRGPARLAVDFNWGEYAIWHVGPRIKVSVDGRRETVYSEDAYQENLRFMAGRAGWDAILDQDHADLALVRRGSPADSLLRLKPRWRLVYDDAVCALFASDDSAAGAELRDVSAGNLPPDGVGLAFPSG